MKRITLTLILATATLAHAQLAPGRWQIYDGGQMRAMTVQEALTVDAVFAAQAQLEIQAQQLRELRAIRQLQEAQQCEPSDSGLPWMKPGYSPLR